MNAKRKKDCLVFTVMKHPAEAVVKDVEVVFLLLKNDQQQMFFFFLKGGKQNPKPEKRQVLSLSALFVGCY